MTESLANRIRTNGWELIDALEPGGVDAALEVIDAHHPDPDATFYASPAASWGAVATTISDELGQILEPVRLRLLPGHRFLLAGITSKCASSPARVPFHQDWTYTDERSTRVVFMWFPLVDVDEENGALAVVPDSHRWFERVRPSRRHEPSIERQDQLSVLATIYPMVAGQALAFDPGIFHGSGPNRTDRPRPAITAVFVPEGVELVHFHEDDDGALSAFKVERQFFTQHDYGKKPTGSTPADAHWPALDLADLDHALEQALATSRAGTKPGLPEDGDDESWQPWNVGDGFEVIRLLDDAAIESLRSVLREAAAGSVVGRGRAAARTTGQAVADSLSSQVRPHLVPHLPGYEPAIVSVWPDQDAEGPGLEMHQDWTYTDERCDRAVIVWIPLDTPKGLSGRMHVVPGSNHWSAGVRAFNCPPATNPLQAELIAISEPVNLAPGDALLTDPATIHGMSPQPGMGTTHALRIVCIPSGSPLLQISMEDGAAVAHLVEPAAFGLDAEHSPTNGPPSFSAWAEPVSTDELEQGIDDTRSAIRSEPRP